ncbi:YqaJ domain-containing protein, partial [Aphis craccivora]
IWINIEYTIRSLFSCKSRRVNKRRLDNRNKISEVVTLNKLNYMTDINGELGQLNIAEEKYCYFVVWSPIGTQIII